MGKLKIFHSEIEDFENIEYFIEGYLSDYWCFDDTQKSGFKYTFKELQEKYFIKSSTKAHELARKLGQAKFRTYLGCGNCLGEVTFKDRKDFVNYDPTNLSNSPNVNGFCQSCYQASLSEDIDRNVQNIYKNLDYAQSFFKEPTLAKISYLEAIFLYHIINFQDFHPERIDKHCWIDFYKSECEGAQFVIHRLVKKGFIRINLNEKEIFDDLNEIKIFYNYGSKYFPSNFLSKLNKKLQKIDDFIYSVTLPQDFSNFYSYSLFLQNKINSKTVSFDDVQDIKKFVAQKRHDELSRLFHDVSNQIRLYSKRLESNDTLTLIAENFNLMQAYNLFWYKTTEAKAAIYDNRNLNQGYKKSSVVYLNAIKKYAEYMIFNPDATRYTRSLPEDYLEAKIERLILSDFLDVYYSYWHKLTTKEIIKIWLDELTVEG